MIPSSHAFLFDQVRPGSQVVRVYNDGLTALLYDQGQEESLREAAPQILFGAGGHLFDDEATLSALRSGALLAYGMHTDNGIDLEVVVGEPLTAQEMAGGEWLQDGPAQIDLPTGRLCIHSYNSLPIGEFGADGQDPGGVATLSPGRYQARLYRKQLPELSETESEAMGEDDWRRMSDEVITDVLVLSPLSADAALPGHNVLFGECIDFAAQDAVEA